MARMAKLSTGWAAHWFLLGLSGSHGCFHATLISYIYNQFTGKSLFFPGADPHRCIFSIVTGYIAYRGSPGDAHLIVINVIQWGTLIVFSTLAHRLSPQQPLRRRGWSSAGWDVIKPHTFDREC